MKAIALGFTLVVMGTATAWAGNDVRRVAPAHRPYIVEIGEPQEISMDRLRREMRRNNDLNDYIGFYGYPEVAEVQEIRPQAPWDVFEVRLFYLRRDVEIAFGRAFVAPTVRDFGVVKYSGRIQPEDWRRLANRTQPADGDPLARLMSAAERAAQAAERAEASSQTAAQAAERAARITDRMETAFHQNLRK